MRQAVAHDIDLINYICYIRELTPEQQSSLKNRIPYLTIPLFVMLYFVEFLCYRHTDTNLAQAALEVIQDLVDQFQRPYAERLKRDICWEILGICQQMTGNLQAAFHSYQQSITQYPWHQIQNAAQMRIRDLHIT